MKRHPTAIRLFTDGYADPDAITMPLEMQAVYYRLLMFAGQGDTPAGCFSDDDIKKLARRVSSSNEKPLGDPNLVKATLEYLLTDADKDTTLMRLDSGALYFRHWEVHQEPTSTARVRAFRRRQDGNGNASETLETFHDVTGTDGTVRLNAPALRKITIDVCRAFEPEIDDRASRNAIALAIRDTPHIKHVSEAWRCRAHYGHQKIESWATVLTRWFVNRERDYVKERLAELDEAHLLNQLPEVAEVEAERMASDERSANVVAERYAALSQMQQRRAALWAASGDPRAGLPDA